MSGRPAVPALVAPLALLLALVLTACMAGPAEVPDGAVPPAATNAATPQTSDETSPPDATELPGDETTRLIALCLSRNGLSQPPAEPDVEATAEERLIFQQKVEEYQRTFTTCSAEALSASSPTPTS